MEAAMGGFASDVFLGQVQQPGASGSDMKSNVGSFFQDLSAAPGFAVASLSDHIRQFSSMSSMKSTAVSVVPQAAVSGASSSVGVPQLLVSAAGPSGELDLATPAAVDDTKPPTSPPLTPESIAAYTNLALTLVGGLIIVSYRLLARFSSKYRSNILLLTKCSIGWVIGNIFLHGIGVTNELIMLVGNICFLVLAGGPDCVAITLTFAWLCGSISALICLPKLAEDPSWERHLATTALASVLTLLCLGVRVVFQNWEVVTLPPLAATALLVCFGMPIVVLDDILPYNMSAYASLPEKSLRLAWCGVYIVGVISQVVSQSSSGKSGNPIDVGNPYGGQNDLMRRLLEEQGNNVSRNELFESRFPILQGMGGGQENQSDPFRQAINQAPEPSGSGGILERAQRTGEPLTENEMKILEICREDEEQRNRLLFGGGLW
ncbi:unnamed protein product [Amoebophrya sp. A25]|nr:unnamed protein product [Amoebophrya sp. A25]|eukprot:GSA25T00005682001.1